MAGGYECDVCGDYLHSPYYADDDDGEYCWSCLPRPCAGNPYDDEADIGYAHSAKGEAVAQAWPAAWKANAQAADARRGPRC